MGEEMVLQEAMGKQHVQTQEAGNVEKTLTFTL
jgi:hypothetical protein